MADEQKESQENADNTAGQTDSADEKNDSTSADDTAKTKEGEEQSEKIVLSKDEYEKISKKAKDFDGLIEKQRIEKFKRREQEEKKEEPIDQEKINELVRQQVAIVLSEHKKKDIDGSLTSVYREFVKDNSWADNDEVVSAISKEFGHVDTDDSEQLRAKMDLVAQKLYPKDYQKSVEDKIRRKIFAEERNINAGDTGGGNGTGGNNGKKNKVEITAEQIALAKKCGNDPEKVYK